MVLTGARTVDRLVESTNRHDVDGMTGCLHEDYRSEQPLHPEAGFGGREQVATNWTAMFAEVPDLRFDVQRAAIAGDEVWTEVRVHGTKRDGRPLEYRGMAVWGLRGDLIAWARLYFEPVQVGGPGIDERIQQVLGRDQ